MQPSDLYRSAKVDTVWTEILFWCKQHTATPVYYSIIVHTHWMKLGKYENTKICMHQSRIRSTKRFFSFVIHWCWYWYGTPNACTMYTNPLCLCTKPRHIRSHFCNELEIESKFECNRSKTFARCAQEKARWKFKCIWSKKREFDIEWNTSEKCVF